MNTAIRFVKPVLLCLLCWLLAGCGAPPTIRQSHVLAANHGKTTHLHFIYRDVDMHTVSTSGIGSVPLADTGFSRFGELLAQKAEAAFARHQIAVTEARVLDGRVRLKHGTISPATDGTMPPVLVVTPASGKTQSNGRATSTSHVFEVHLLELGRHRLLWAATIDTSIWSGHDLVLQHVQKTLYDEAYADQLLKAVADQMKHDGII